MLSPTNLNILADDTSPSVEGVRVIGNRLIETASHSFTRMANMIVPITHVNVTETPNDSSVPNDEARVVVQKTGVSAGNIDITSNATRTMMQSLMVVNPLNHIAVIPPPNGCSALAHASYTARVRHCRYALAGGAVDSNKKTCAGSVISHGKHANGHPDHEKPHFGVTDDGYFFFGSLSDDVAGHIPSDNNVWSRDNGHKRLDTVPVLNEGIPGIEDISPLNITRDTLFIGDEAKTQINHIRRPSWKFIHLISGDRFLIRSGKVACFGPENCPSGASPSSEDPAVLTARSAVGVSSDGRLFLVTVDSFNDPTMSSRSGVSSWTLASALRAMGVYHALELQSHSASLISNYIVTSNTRKNDMCPNGMDLAEENHADLLSTHQMGKIVDYYSRFPLLSPEGAVHNKTGVYATPTCSDPAAAVLCVYDADDVPMPAASSGLDGFARDESANVIVSFVLASSIVVLFGVLWLMSRARKRVLARETSSDLYRDTMLSWSNK